MYLFHRNVVGLQLLVDVIDIGNNIISLLWLPAKQGLAATG